MTIDQTFRVLAHTYGYPLAGSLDGLVVESVGSNFHCLAGFIVGNGNHGISAIVLELELKGSGSVVNEFGVGVGLDLLGNGINFSVGKSTFYTLICEGVCIRTLVGLNVCIFSTIAIYEVAGVGHGYGVVLKAGELNVFPAVAEPRGCTLKAGHRHGHIQAEQTTRHIVVRGDLTVGFEGILVDILRSKSTTITPVGIPCENVHEPEFLAIVRVDNSGAECRNGKNGALNAIYIDSPGIVYINDVKIAAVRKGIEVGIVLIRVVENRIGNTELILVGVNHGTTNVHRHLDNRSIEGGLRNSGQTGAALGSVVGSSKRNHAAVLGIKAVLSPFGPGLVAEGKSTLGKTVGRIVLTLDREIKQVLVFRNHRSEIHIDHNGNLLHTGRESNLRRNGENTGLSYTILIGYFTGKTDCKLSIGVLTADHYLAGSGIGGNLHSARIGNREVNGVAGHLVDGGVFNLVGTSGHSEEECATHEGRKYLVYLHFVC